jgi:fatty-acyl-CoA synthase
VKDQQVTWGEMHDRVAKFSSILSERFNINRFQVSPNTHAAMELHFSVPGNQGILHSINTRLDDAGVAFQLQHAESTLLVVDVEFLPLARNALALLPQHKTTASARHFLY